MTVLDHPTRARFEVHPFDNLVLDTVRASLLRERDLERHATAADWTKFVLADLNGIRSLDVQAAYELIGKWIAGLRLNRAAGTAPLIAVTADNLDILRTVHAALRDSRNAAYALLHDRTRPERLVPIGDLVNQDVADLNQIQETGPTKGDGAVPLERLKDLWKRGLLLLDSQGRYARPTAEDFEAAS